MFFKNKYEVQMTDKKNFAFAPVSDQPKVATNPIRA
jgi:hypothetical protein